MRILSSDQISKIFINKASSKGVKFIEENDFIDVISEIYQLECE